MTGRSERTVYFYHSLKMFFFELIEAYTGQKAHIVSNRKKNKPKSYF